ncbi:non-ribosomal peptide synthetase [Beggiatoa sp. PS]|nr:non-ribosomal peptide synthetase [Beggiatoa sp. PS]
MNQKRCLLSGKGSAGSRDEGIVAFFEKQVKKWAIKPALVCGHRTYTYKELNEEANKIALCLAEKNLPLESIIGIVASRSDVLVFSELGILKAGYAYLPLDPLLPEERLSFLLQDSNCRVVLYERNKRHRVPMDIECLNINEIIEQTFVNPFASVACSGSSLAYVMYTSGTTGKPKGSLIEHKSIIRLVVNTNYIAITEADRICMASSPSFDASTFELWGALLNGAELHILNESILRSPNQLVDWLRDRGISIIFLTTALFNQLVMWNPQFAASLRVVLFGGETADVDCVNHFATCNPKVQLINGYGPTENTTFSMAYRIQGVQQQDVPIGKPIANSQAYIYDREGCQCPVGQIGEICVAGEGLSRGYLNRPDLTVLKFVQNPDMPGTLMYRTGDLGYWDRNGNIHFSGRSDNQVKLRGHRIELGEIENTLQQLRGIREIVVKDWGVGGDKYLCVYYTAARELSSNAIRIFLQERLPAYMVPSKFVWLEEMPVSWNGKVDRQALLIPSQVALYDPPVTALERLLVAIWSEVLGQKSDCVGVHDRFDEIGGNSLLAMQVMSRLLEHDYQIEMSNFAELPNIRELAKHCYRRVESSWQGEIIGEAPLTFLQEFVFRTQDPQIVNHYNIAVYHRLDTPIGAETLQYTYRRLITHHDGLRIVFVRTSVGISQQCLPVSDFPNGAFVYDYCGETDPAARIEEQSQALQTQFDLERGPLFRLILFKTNDCDHLLILLHHLIADLYSVSIIMDDLTKLLDSKNDREKIKLPPKTESMLSFAKRLRIIDVNEAHLSWKSVNDNVTVNSDNISCFGDMKYLTVQLDEEVSSGIILGIPHSKKSGILETLLTALGYSWHDYTGRDHLVTYLVQHGRQLSPNEGFNFRTVGWFASANPYTICIDSNEDILSNIQTTKNTLQKGCLAKAIPIEKTETPIAFNYLGKMDAYDLVGVSEPAFNFGELASPKLKIVADYSLSVLEKNGFVIVTLLYSNRFVGEGDAKSLLNSYCDTLRKFVNSLLS